VTQGDGEHKPLKRIGGCDMFRRRTPRVRNVPYVAGVITYGTSVNDN
jgi:hypothetical protein